MKKYIYTILTLIILLALASYFYLNNHNEKPIRIKTSVYKITVVSMPSPPKTIVLTNKDDIDRIVSLLNEIKCTKVKSDNINGWTYKITFEGSKTHNLSFIGDTINFNGSIYKVTNSVSILEELKKLLEQSNNH